VHPWLLAEHTIGPLTLRGGVSRAGQFPDIDAFEHAGSPMVAASDALVDAGVEYRLSPALAVQATGFHRTETGGIRRLDEFRLLPLGGIGLASTLNPFYGSDVTSRSRGFELLLRRRGTAGLTGWIGYSYARTRDEDIRRGETYDGDFDQRHTLNVFVRARVSDHFAANVKVRVGSNVPLVGYFKGTVDPDVLTLSTARNQVRLPLYARVDLRLDRTFTFDRRRITAFIEIINVLNRRNIRQMAGSVFGSTASNFTQREIPIIPSIGILIEF
jgi:hypothetical protein